MKNPSLIIVIPCHDEPDLLGTLRSLWRCRRAEGETAVIVVINQAGNAAAAVRANNRRTREEARAWIDGHRDPRLSFHLLYEPDLPPKHAGVGLARRIGMDLAADRFYRQDRPAGPIVCLDADCTVDENYLQQLGAHFRDHPDSPGCSIHFEHPLTGLPARERLGIASYELHLRLYRQGLLGSRFPYAFHTIGSSMAVRAEPYRRQGGMNKRKAGEDFYFLHKIMPLGGFTDLLTTTVHPAPRPSHRVPFGTGRAMATWLAGTEIRYAVYDPRVYQNLRAWFEMVPTLREPAAEKPLLATLPDDLCDFLRQRRVDHQLAEIRANTTSPAAFQKRFFHWFNGFMVLKYIHWATDHAYPRVAVNDAALTLLDWLGETAPDLSDLPEAMKTERLLDRFRHLDKNPRGPTARSTA